MRDRLPKLIVDVLVPARTGKSSEHIRAPWRVVLSWVLKIGMSGGAIWYIYHQLDAARAETGASWFFSPLTLPLPLLLLAFALMLINWGLEVWKWHLLLQPIFKTHWRTSVKGVLSGATVGVFSPNRIGEFFGRILALHPVYRIGGSLLSTLNSAAQTLATLTFGIVGFLYLLEVSGGMVFSYAGQRSLQILLLVFLLVATLMYGRIGRLLQSRWLRYQLRRWRIVLPLDELKTSVLWRLYGLSIVRFCSFLLQYFVAFEMLGAHQSWYAIGAATTLSLFSSTLLSFIPVPDLLLREAVALNYFPVFGFDATLVAEAVFFVWVINIALPAIAGAFILLSYRIFRSK